MSNLKAEFARTALQRAGAIDLALVRRVFAELEAEAMAWFEAERVPEPARRIRRQASLRYQHQGFELFVPWDAGEVTQAAMAETVRSFHRMHERLYTFAQEDTPVEMVTLSIAAEGVFPPPKLEELASGLPDALEPALCFLPRARVQAEQRHLALVRIGGDSPHSRGFVGAAVAEREHREEHVATVDRFGSLVVTERG